MYKFFKFWKQPEKKPESPKILVAFDGDQVTSKTLRAFVKAKKPGIKYIWIQAGKNLPKNLPEDFSRHIVPNFGKEAVDTMLSILITQECCQNKELREVHVVSGDGDMINMNSMLANLFPNVVFTVLHMSEKALKKGATQFLTSAPKNCKLVNIVVK